MEIKTTNRSQMQLSMDVWKEHKRWVKKLVWLDEWNQWMSWLMWMIFALSFSQHCGGVCAMPVCQPLPGCDPSKQDSHLFLCLSFSSLESTPALHHSLSMGLHVLCQCRNCAEIVHAWITCVFIGRLHLKGCLRMGNFATILPNEHSILILDWLTKWLPW